MLVPERRWDRSDNMKKHYIILLLAVPLVLSFCTVGLPGIARAQESIALTAGGGAAFPSKPDELVRYWQPGAGITGGMEYRFTPVLSLTGRIDYDRFPMNGDLLLSDLGARGLGISLEGGEVSLTLISGNLTVYPLPSIPEVRPYLMAGAG